jgi:hypothetical protein
MFFNIYTIYNEYITIYNEYITNYIKVNKLDFYTKEITPNGNCGVYTLYEYLRNKVKNINIKKH